MNKTVTTLLLGLALGVTVTLLIVKKDVLVEKRVEVVNEESVVTKVVETATPSVVTISMVGSGDLSGQDVGTGFIISADGLILTNKHVVADNSVKYKVVVGKDQVVDVKEIYRDPVDDLAILRVNKSGLSSVTMGDSDKIKVGQTVIAIGTALGEFRSTVTKGVISGLGRGITAGSGSGAEKLENVIQTDAAINPGNSGGPLFNSNGEVIGVNVAVSQNGKGIGFALPINLVKDVINNFKTTGEFDRPYLGVAYQLITKQAALLNNVSSGAYVQGIVVGSPAEKAGVKKGDIITNIDSMDLSSEKNTSLATYINKKKIGEAVVLKLRRDGKEMTISVTLEKRPS